MLESDEGLFGAELDDEQRLKLGRIQAFMAAAEGYGDHVMHALGHRIWGFSPEAFDDPDSLQPPTDPAARQAMVQAVQQTYPYIAMIALDAVGGDLSAVGAGCDEQFEFEFSLDLLLDAFERLQEAGWRSAR